MVTEDIGFKPSTEIGAEIWNCKACSVADLASFFVFFGGVFSQVLCWTFLLIYARVIKYNLPSTRSD